MTGGIREDDLEKGGPHQQEEQEVMNCIDHVKEYMLQGAYEKAAQKGEEMVQLLKKIAQEKR